MVDENKYTWIGTVAENPMLIFVPHKVLDVTHFVVDSHKVFLVDSSTHFDAIFYIE